ncbi:MAG TPA: metallophosphoesterase [Trueperaceae bacterium]
MKEDTKYRAPTGVLRAIAAAVLLVALAGCSTLTDLFPGGASDLEFVEPRAGSQVSVGNSVPVRVDTSAVSTPLESVHLEVNGDWVGVLSDSDGDGDYTGSFMPTREGRFRLSAIGIGEDGSIRRGTIELVGGDHPGFSIVMIPDTQSMIEIQSNTMFSQMTGWIAQQQDALDIEFVTHVGDIVEHGSSGSEWSRADAAMDELDGVVAYSTTVGNHDYADRNNKESSTALYRQYFGSQRYSGYGWYGGAGPRDTNHYQIFDAGGQQFLHLALEWEAPTDVLTWARGILEANPGMPTIITTHAYLWDNPGAMGHSTITQSVTSSGDPYPGSSSGEEIYQALVRPYPQVFMVLGGHFHMGPDGEDGEYHQVSSNDAGLPVYEMLADYQTWENGGQGWLRIIQFIPGGGAGGLDRIAVRTYSPVLSRYQTDANSQFHFDLSFAQRFGID